MSLSRSIYIYIHIYIYVYMYICVFVLLRGPMLLSWKTTHTNKQKKHSGSLLLPPSSAHFGHEIFLGRGRGKRSHTRNRHLRNHRGFSAAFSNIISLVSGIFQRIGTCPVDVYWIRPMDLQWHFPTDFPFCEFWCVIFCPEEPHCTATRPPSRGN